MRILIFSQGRCGSTSLTTYIGNSLNLEKIYEPTNPNKNGSIDIDSLFLKDNIVVKIMEWELLNLNMSFEDIKTQFDKTIILTREDVNEQAESFYNSIENDKWDVNWNINDIKNFSIEKLNNIKTKLEKDKEFLLNLMGEHFTYESIFITGNDIEKLNNYLDIIDIKFLNILNKNNKLRYTKFTNKLI